MSHTSDKTRLAADELVALEGVMDDYYGLWEIPIEFFESAIPGFRAGNEIQDDILDAVVDWVMSVFECLYEQGVIDVFRGTKFCGEQILLSKEKSREEISKRLNYDWRKVSAIHIRVWGNQTAYEYLQNYPPADSLKDRLRKIWDARCGSTEISREQPAKKPESQ